MIEIQTSILRYTPASAAAPSVNALVPLIIFPIHPNSLLTHLAFALNPPSCPVLSPQCAHNGPVLGFCLNEAQQMGLTPTNTAGRGRAESDNTIGSTGPERVTLRVTVQ